MIFEISVCLVGAVSGLPFTVPVNARDFRVGLRDKPFPLFELTLVRLPCKIRQETRA